jgi:hypothetical protein
MYVVGEYVRVGGGFDHLFPLGALARVLHAGSVAAVIVATIAAPQVCLRCR